MNKKIRMRVNYYEQSCDPIIVVKIDMKPTLTIAVQVYMPTSSVDEEIEEMYEEVKEIVQLIKEEETLIVMGYWNSVVRKDMKPTLTIAVQVYMPTSSVDEEIEEMYEEVKEIIQLIKEEETLIVMGYWNSVVRKEIEGKIGEQGLGKRNETGSCLVEFCMERDITCT